MHVYCWYTAIYRGNNNNCSPPFFYWLGIIFWVVGFIFESVGDFQLSEFLSKRKQKQAIMKYGIWKYTRHPNYFGEVMQWWRIGFMAVTMRYGWISLISPIIISILIIGVSGIPMLEKRYEGDIEFEAYKKTTSTFFPWIPKT